MQYSPPQVRRRRLTRDQAHDVVIPFASLTELAGKLRNELEAKKYVLLYAYNGTGKTRLSMEFKDLGKQGDARDTLYFNAFTEDLFSWDNDLEADSERKLKLNKGSHFFDGLKELEMDNRIRPLLQRYADFDFRIDTDEGCVHFSRAVGTTTIDDIKVSRGEENIFIWCFFLAILQLAMDGAEAYQWVKYVYIDDPISSLDEHNAIAVASHLIQRLKSPNHSLKSVISTHSTLFFNVLFNELRKPQKARSYYFLRAEQSGPPYSLFNQGDDTPFFYHVAMLQELDQAVKNDKLYTYHFNMLRSVLEKTASFRGFHNFGACIPQGTDDPNGIVHTRMVNILSHGNYSLYEPREMVGENKQYFRTILNNFKTRYLFNPALFPEELPEV